MISSLAAFARRSACAIPSTAVRVATARPALHAPRAATPTQSLPTFTPFPATRPTPFHRPFSTTGPLFSKAHVGVPAPCFEGEALVGSEFKKIKLGDYRGKYLVFFWYPLDFTFVCPTEIISFSEHADKFRAINCEVVGASCDSKFTHLAWSNTSRKEGGLGKLNIPLLADFDKTIAADYGVLLSGQSFPLRATFIIDDKGTVRHLSFNDPPVGRNVDEVLRLVQGYQFVDKHGEVCPANWKPGAATIVPDPVKSKQFFTKQ